MVKDYTGHVNKVLVVIHNKCCKVSEPTKRWQHWLNSWPKTCSMYTCIHIQCAWSMLSVCIPTVCVRMLECLAFTDGCSVKCQWYRLIAMHSTHTDKPSTHFTGNADKTDPKPDDEESHIYKNHVFLTIFTY